MLSAADVHVAHAARTELAGEDDESVLLAAALAVRGPRLGHVFVDLATIRETASVDADEPVDLAALPWPEPDDWIRAPTASALVAVGEDGEPGRPLRLLGSAAVPRSLLARGASGRRRPRGTERSRGGGGRRRAGSPSGSTGCSRRCRQPAAARPPRPPRCGASPWSPAARERARRRRSPGSSRCSPSRRSAPVRGRRSWRWPHPTGKAAARLEEAVHAEAARLDVSPMTSRPPARAPGLDAAPPARLAARQPQPLPPRPRQPPATRRGDRRRDLDGVAVAHGQAGRGGPARCATDPRRRSRPARLDRGRGRARRHRRDRPPRPQRPGRFGRGFPARQPDRVSAAGSSCSTACTATARASPGWPRRSAVGTATRPWPRSPVRPAEITWLPIDVETAEADAALGVVRDAAVAAGQAVIDDARSGHAGEALEALGAVPPPVRAPPGGPRRGDWTSRIEAWLSERIDDLDLDQRDLRRAAAAGHRERLRARPLQRRHRRDRPAPRDRADAVFDRGGDADQLQPAAARRRSRRCTR